MSLFSTFFSIFLIIIVLFILYKILYYNKHNNSEIIPITKLNCLDTRFGCCNDKITPRLDQRGTNCRGF